MVASSRLPAAQARRLAIDRAYVKISAKIRKVGCTRTGDARR
jgi:hypothetical protein